MPANKSKNLRSGDLGEEFGLYLLKPYTVISQVPRTEDVGIDAIVTLLKNLDNRNYTAGNSFYLQLKSKSISTVQYSKDAIPWLLSLDLPLMYGIVDRLNFSIQLYSTAKLSEYIAVTKDISEITIAFDDDYQMQDFSNHKEGSISIGPPILDFEISKHNDSTFYETFYAIVAPHVQLLKENLETRRFGFIYNISWKTNEIPKRQLWKSSLSAKNPGEGFEHIDNLMAPYFSVWLDECLRGKELETLEDRLDLLNKAKQAIQILSRPRDKS
ncbi:hypothetical protein EHQ43_18555 [Leptospira bouyouniensis]|uniref:DUF4365 domain-containing protein n=1 Tax=Leptospira bouyouniensis TaxID=2484911 RepID=A0A7I0HM47_9LEPT|nr:hypothetical protein [Leptospira bouyouniensis]TGL01905.1 hypothetical protein EHQ43_18555 [Leptospira bouyouniensis]